MILELKIPKSWSEVSLRRFEELTEAVSSNENNPWILTARTLAALCDMDFTEVKSWPVSVLQSPELAKSLEFIKTDPKKRMPQDKITLGGKQYNVRLYPQKWTAGQWLDFTTISKDPSDVKKIARLIACFTVPKGKEYGKDYDFDSVVNDINEFMDIETALGYSGFFQLQFDGFTKALLAYSEKNLKKIRKSISRQESRSNRRKAKKIQDTRQNGQAS